MSKRALQNNVGHNLPSPQDVSEMSGASGLLLQKASSYGPPVADRDSARLNTVRTGYEKIAETVLRLADRFEAKVAKLSPASVRADMALAEALEPIAQDTDLAARRFQDVIRQANSEAWEGVLAYYAVLRAMAKNDPELTDALQGVVDFMALGPRETGGESL
jgi:hypothetical protein